MHSVAGMQRADLTWVFGRLSQGRLKPGTFVTMEPAVTLTAAGLEIEFSVPYTIVSAGSSVALTGHYNDAGCVPLSCICRKQFDNCNQTYL